eukprot:5298514-Alexandrium_andersonii.AAC.1
MRQRTPGAKAARLTARSPSPLSRSPLPPLRVLGARPGLAVGWGLVEARCLESALSPQTHPQSRTCRWATTRR